MGAGMNTQGGDHTILQVSNAGSCNNPPFLFVQQYIFNQVNYN